MTREQWEAHLALKGWWGERLRPEEDRPLGTMWFIVDEHTYVAHYGNEIYTGRNANATDSDCMRIPFAAIPAEVWSGLILYLEQHPEIL